MPGSKANRIGWGRPLVWQLRRGSFGWQDAGLFTVGSPGLSEPLPPTMGLGDYLHSREERSQRPGPVLRLPRMRRGGASWVLQP